MIAYSSGAAPEEDSQPANHVRMQISSQQAVEEKGVVHPIESLGQVGGSHHSAERRFALIKTIRDSGGEGKEGGNGGSAGTETVLKGSFRERGKEERTEKALKDLRSRAEKGNGAIGGA